MGKKFVRDCENKEALDLVARQRREALGERVWFHSRGKEGGVSVKETKETNKRENIKIKV